MNKRSSVKYHGVTKKLRILALREIPDPVCGAPPEAAHERFWCSCGASFAPPWEEKLPIELAIWQTDEATFNVPSVIELLCPRCRAQHEFRLPIIIEAKGQIVFYGDEAEQRLELNEVIYAYALLAFAPNLVPLAAQTLSSAKLKLRPNEDPNTWPWHTYDIRDKRWRAEHKIDLSHREVDDIIRSLVDMLGANEENRIISVSMLPPSRTSESSDAIFERVLTVALLSTTQLSTSMGYAPRFFLEARTDDHSKDMIDYAVERIGRGLRHSLPFLYISRGITPSIPVTLPKGARMELEYADLIAFIVRRSLLRSFTGKRIEFPVDSLGEVYWTVLGPNGFERSASVGLPAR